MAEVAESGRASGRAELRALREGRAWPNADDSAELVPIPDASGCVGMSPDASRMRPDASGCAGILNPGKIPAIQNLVNLANLTNEIGKK